MARGAGGIGLGGTLVIVGVVLMFVWSFWTGLIVALISLIAFGGFAKGKWWYSARPRCRASSGEHVRPRVHRCRDAPPRSSNRDVTQRAAAQAAMRRFTLGPLRQAPGHGAPSTG